MRNVLAFARFAEAVALDGTSQHHRRSALVLHGLLVGVVDLARVVTAERHRSQLVVGEVFDHVEQSRIDTPEVLSDVGAGLDRVLLVLAVDDLAHALNQQTVPVLGQQRVPVVAPQHLDDVPARTAEHGFEFLDDLAVAAHRTVETLKIAVDDEDEIVEFFAGGKCDGAEGFWFVGFTVTQESPDLRGRLRLETAILQVAHESRLVNRLNGSEAHRDRRILPEVGHQPGVRIRREAAALFHLTPEVLEMLLVEPAFEIRPGVDARCGVSLEIDCVGIRAVVAAEEVVERHLVQRGRRRKRRDVSADAV